jgi:alanine-glyoxylate transaminase/serine-glyoxylate transaminase/serine-pyruvate transaminase
MTDVAERCGARVTRVESPWGEPVDVQAFARAVASARPVAAAFVHAETSTGALSDAAALARAARDGGALPVMDCVTSLGGVALDADAWGIAAAYSGTQKCLASPPGLSPVTVSDDALARIRRRKSKVRSWYLDFTMLADYWGEGRAYHHTAPITAIYGLRESLRLIEAEGAEARFRRHRRAQSSLLAGLGALGLEPLVARAEHRLPPLTAIRVPDGVDEAALRKRLLAEHGIEIGGGLGPLKGKIVRIGLMGHGARIGNVVLVLAAILDALRHAGRKASGDPVAAALARWAEPG